MSPSAKLKTDGGALTYHAPAHREARSVFGLPGTEPSSRGGGTTPWGIFVCQYGRLALLESPTQVPVGVVGISGAGLKTKPRLHRKMNYAAIESMFPLKIRNHENQSKIMRPPTRRPWRGADGQGIKHTNPRGDREEEGSSPCENRQGHQGPGRRGVQLIRIQ